MSPKQFLIFSKFVFDNNGNCECGFPFISGDMMKVRDENVNDRTVVAVMDDGTYELYCPECGNQLATITTYDVDEGFDEEMLQPFRDAGVPLPFDRLDEMQDIYASETP